MKTWAEIEERALALQESASAEAAAIQSQRDALRLRLAFDTGLAVGTTQLLRAVKDLINTGETEQASYELYTYAEELQPLADFYGVRIVESAIYKSLSSVELKV